MHSTGEGPEAALTFDSRTRAVMANPAQQDGIRQKVSAVREVVRGRSNDEITQVLQHYDNDVPSTIQAFLDGDAAQVLQEWHHTGSKQPAKQKRNKKKATKLQADTAPAAPEIPPEISPPEINPPETPPHVNGTAHVNDESAVVISPKSLTESISSTTSSLSTLSHDSKPIATMNGKKSVHQHHHRHPQPPRNNAQPSSARSRTQSEASVSSESGSKRSGTYAGLEKSMKDLQRQVSSLQRLKTVMADGFDVSFKCITSSFEDFRKCLNDREAEVIFEMDHVKRQTTDMLSKRQHTANELKNRAMKAQLMSDHELATLRTDIKHFASERKIDDDISSTKRFTWDADQSKQFLKSVCSVVPVKTTYQHQGSFEVSLPLSPGASASDAITPQLEDATGAKVVTQSESLTQFEKSGAPIVDIQKSAPPRSPRRSAQANNRKPANGKNSAMKQTADNNRQTTDSRRTPDNRQTTDSRRTPNNRQTGTRQTTGNNNRTAGNNRQTTGNNNRTTDNNNRTKPINKTRGKEHIEKRKPQINTDDRAQQPQMPAAGEGDAAAAQPPSPQPEPKEQRPNRRNPAANNLITA